MSVSVDIVDIVVGYSGRALSRPLRFQSRAGSAVGIIGENGIGKSAFLKTLAGILPSLGGSIRVDGLDITTWPTFRRVRVAGLRYLPQQHRVLTSLTVGENLHLAMSVTRKGWNERDAAIRAFLNKPPFATLAPFLKRPAATLSGGQVVLLGLCGLLAANARVLLLDEPTAGLSVGSQRLIAETLRRLKAERMIVIAEQNIQLLFEIADTIYVLRRESAEVDLGALHQVEESRRAEVQRLYSVGRVRDAECAVSEAMAVP